MIKGFEEAINIIKYDIRHFDMYDLTADEFEDSIRNVFDRLAKENGHPPIDWEDKEEEEDG